ncbi:MAG: hypothetical protein MR210_05040 [Erysipelotrichaceae bacterium]|nr:hypothetical protein [Erysipelotrichaceae bacterium]MDY5251778.1 hypothetical protein [Erysipelotrichaceae bacterium]
MKKLLWLLILVLLVSCSKTFDPQSYYENSVAKDISGKVTITNNFTLDDNELSFDFSYEFASNAEGSYIDVNNEQMSTRLLAKDGVAFAQAGDNLYQYDDYDRLYDLLLPLAITKKDIVKSEQTDGKWSLELSAEATKRLLKLNDASIDSNRFVYDIVDDKIAKEEIFVEYHVQDESHSYHKVAEYHYEPVTIDLSAFAYMDEDYQNFKGVCSFDNGASSIKHDLIIEDGQVIAFDLHQTSHLDVISSITDNVEDYIVQLQALYDGTSGIQANIYLQDEQVITQLDVDMATIDDKGLALLDISKDGNELMQKLYSKGYHCQKTE